MKCCFHGTTCTSNVLLFPRYILWFKLNSLKVKNISFWKIRCCEALESTNHVSLQIAKIGKTIMKILVLHFVAICEEPLNLLFQYCFFLCYSLTKWPLVPQLQQAPLLFCFSFLNFLQFTNLSNYSKTPIAISFSCFVLWLNCTFHLHHKSSCKNCLHTNSTNNWSLWILNESTKVWKDGGKYLKSVNAKSS
jgi:hypothetical protein